MPAEERLKLSRNYFIIGFLLLPFVWLTNAVWFWPDCFGARVSDNLEIRKTFKKYVIGSLAGCAVWTLILASWVAYFQMNRKSWDSSSDYLYYWLPYGSA